MAEIPDFRTRTPSVDPMAFANVLQRKAQMEQDQRNLDRQRKDNQINNLMQAVVTGQTIASNMMTLAEKRNTRQATEDISVIQQEPSADPILSASRPQRLLEAISRRSPETFDKAMLESAMPNKNKGFAPQQASVELQNGKIIPAAFVNGRYLYPNTDQEIPPEEIAGKGYGLVPMENADGSISYVSRSTAKKRATLDTATGIVPEKEKGTLKFISQLNKNDRKVVLDEIDKAKSDPVINKAKDSLKSLDSVLLNLDQNNKVAIDRLGGLVQKLVALDSGNLAQWEQRDPGSRDVVSRIKQYYTMSTKGELSTENKKELRALLKNAETNLIQNMDDTAESHADSITAQFPRLNKDYVKSTFGLGVYSRRIAPNDIDKKVDDFFGSLLNQKD